MGGLLYALAGIGDRSPAARRLALHTQPDDNGVHVAPSALGAPAPAQVQVRHEPAGNIVSPVPIPAQATEGGPHSESPPARFIEAYAAVYVLVGSIYREAGARDGDPFELRVSPGVLRDLDAEFLPMMQFFRTARTEQQATDWLAWAGAPQDGLKDLVKSRLLVRVNTTSPLTAAASLKGVRIIPCSIPGEPARDQPTLISVRRDTSSPVEAFVSVELEHVLWGWGWTLIFRRLSSAWPASPVSGGIWLLGACSPMFPLC
jgi:hypothetical protein